VRDKSVLVDLKKSQPPCSWALASGKKRAGRFAELAQSVAMLDRVWLSVA
jgi:hypothetical protein